MKHIPHHRPPHHRPPHHRTGAACASRPLHLGLAALILALAAVLLAQPNAAWGQETKTTQHKDWAVVCPANGNCVATHQPEGLRILVGREQSSGELRSALLVGPDTAKGAAMTVWLDTGTTIELIISECRDDFCEAGIAADKTPAVIDAFKRAAKGIVAYVAGDRVRVVEFSLSGSTAAIGAAGG